MKKALITLASLLLISIYANAQYVVHVPYRHDITCQKIDSFLNRNTAEDGDTVTLRTLIVVIKTKYKGKDIHFYAFSKTRWNRSDRYGASDEQCFAQDKNDNKKMVQCTYEELSKMVDNPFDILSGGGANGFYYPLKYEVSKISSNVYTETSITVVPDNLYFIEKAD